MSAVAIIPARGGSKRIPRKNIREFCGKPMIAWSIQTALESGCFDQVIVSTDDQEIAGISRAFGAEVPFVRPLCLADDVTPTSHVIRHAIQWLKDNEMAPETVCCLYATAPFITPLNLQLGLRKLRSHPELEFVFSGTRFSFPIFRAVREKDDGRIEMLWPEHALSRSQDLPETFHDAGQFYWGTSSAFLLHDSCFTARAGLFELPNHLVQDIDTIDDWRRAELIFKISGIA